MITQPQHLPSQGDENEVSRSATIDAFHEQDVFNLLLTVGSGASDEFQEHDVIVLETLFHLLKGVDARKLFMEDTQLDKEEINELQSLMRKEKAMLNNQNKHGPTRHNRFGTMVWVKREGNKVSTVTGQSSITNSSTTLQQMDASKRFDKPRFRGKQTIEFNESEDFGERVELTDKARKHLRSFVEDFLDSSFNPLFSNLRKGVEREEDRIAPSNQRQYWFLISWFLQAEAARREKRRTELEKDGGRATESEDNTFAYIAAVLDQETFVLLNRHMQRALDEKNWPELRATLVCFTQILLTVQNMADSKDDEDQEIAENIQNRIFYEESTHDRIVQICRTYSNQGFGYLDAVTECVHVFVRMLETYSKQNVDLQIRSKRRARKKQKKQQPQAAEVNDGVDHDDDAEDAVEDEQEAHLTIRERNFDFARFSAKFLSQGCVDTFVTLTHFYADLTPAQLKRCHRFFYRLAFKHDLSILTFRVDILLLFRRMIKGPAALSPETEGFKDWQTLVQQLFRRCFKWIDRETEGEGWREGAVVEMLFSKISGTMYYLQNGFERVIERRAPRAPAELEVRPSVVEVEKRVGVAVSVMLEFGKGDAVEWVKKEVLRAIQEREAWDAEGNARPSTSQPPDPASEDSATTAPALPATVFLSPDSDSRKESLFKDKHLRLLLTTLGLERLGTADDTEASWIVPAELSTSQLKERLDQIRSAEFDPPSFEDGVTAQELIRTKPTITGRNTSTFPDSDSDSDAEEAAFPPNLREKPAEGAEQPKKRRRLTKRNRAELTDEQVAEREAKKCRKEKERNGKIRSKLFVTESDEESDEERDREFFRLEEERRRRVDGEIRRVMKKRVLEGVDGVESGRSGSGSDGEVRKRKRRVGEGSGVDEDDVMDVDGVMEGVWSEDSDGEDEAGGMDRRPRKSRRRSISPGSSSDASASSKGEQGKAGAASASAGVDDEDTPSTSPPVLNKAVSGLPLLEVSGNTAPAPFLEDDEDDEDDMPVIKAPMQRRSGRVGIVVSDDEDE
jgi:replication fork protection complex subunit Tof1/Swi1